MTYPKVSTSGSPEGSGVPSSPRFPEIEERVLAMRFGLDGRPPMTLKQIGRVVGLTRERVRQIERDALEGLKRGFKHVLPTTYVDQRNAKHDRRVG